MLIRNPPLYFAPYRKKEPVSNLDYHISVKFDGREPKPGDRVDVTLPGRVVNYNSTDGDIWVDLDPHCVEYVEHDDSTGKDSALVFTNVKNVVPGVPELAAGQVYRKNHRTYMVYRDKPLSQGGHLTVRDALTGMMVGEGSLIGAELVYNPKEND